MITKEQKILIEKELQILFGRVNLLCDGFEIILSVEQVNTLKFKVIVYVNGYYKGEWSIPKDKVDCPEAKFLCKRVTRLHSVRKKNELIKQFGKRKAYEFFDLDKTFTFFSPYFPSGKAALNHLIKVCDSIELVKLGL